MANLMLTKQCNLHCSHCFANEFVNRQSDVMSYENFLTCLDFLTNGILLDRFFTKLRNGKFIILLNLNSPAGIGQSNFERTIRNIDQMINHLYIHSQVQLSLNVYAPNMDYQYMLDTLQRFHMKCLRLSVAVPNIEAGREVDPLAYFRSMADTVRALVKDLLEIGVAPTFDCNYIPFCIFDDQDNMLASQYPEIMKRSNILRINPICSPVLDILPDLQVVRCFGMSSLYKVNLLDFRNTQELQRHFDAEIDKLAYHVLPSSECKNCREYAVLRCSGGCYAYRLEKFANSDRKSSRFGEKRIMVKQSYSLCDSMELVLTSSLILSPETASLYVGSYFCDRYFCTTPGNIWDTAFTLHENAEKKRCWSFPLHPRHIWRRSKHLHFSLPQNTLMCSTKSS